MTDNRKGQKERFDQLFKGNNDWWNNACLNFTRSNYELYALGYKQAGGILAEHINQKRRFQNSLIYPLIFLYRHFLERRLKGLIIDGSVLLDRNRRKLETHDIKSLWARCREILEKIFEEDNSANFDRLQKIIQQLSERDPDAQAFRYPTLKNKKPSLPCLGPRMTADIGSRLDTGRGRGGRKEGSDLCGFGIAAGDFWI